MKILLILLLCLIPISCIAQQNNKQLNSRDSVLLDSKYPSVYISFEKYDKRKPRYPYESDDGIWLRFHNNSIWNITIITEGVNKEYGDFGIFYEIKSRNREMSDSEIPTGYRSKHITRAFTLKSGEFFVFSIPREHLATDLFLVSDFSYDWEQGGDSGGNGYIIHRATFYSFQLPRE